MPGGLRGPARRSRYGLGARSAPGTAGTAGDPRDPAASAGSEGLEERQTETEAMRPCAGAGGR